MENGDSGLKFALNVILNHFNLTSLGRTKVKSIARNHAIQSLIESYLALNPEKKRPDEDIKEMDDNTKLTDDMVGALAYNLIFLGSWQKENLSSCSTRW